MLHTIILLLSFCSVLGGTGSESAMFKWDKNAEECDFFEEGARKKFIGDCTLYVYRDVGDSVKLICNNTIPEDDILWFKDGHSLNVTDSIFFKDGLVVADSGNYTCHHDDRELDAHRLRVQGIIPMATCRCRSRGKFNCSWNGTASSNQLPTIYQMELTYSQDYTQYNTCTFQTNTRNHLFESSHPTKGYTGHVRATNCFGDSVSRPFNVDPLKSLQSLPPRNVQLVALNTSFVNVTFDLPEEWEADELSVLDKFVFQYKQSAYVTTEVEVGRKDVKEGPAGIKMNYSLKVRNEPYSEVCVNVALIASRASDFSEVGCGHTAMAKPSSGPKSFNWNHTQENNNPEKRSVYFNWEPLPPREANGIIIKYRLILWTTSNATTSRRERIVSSNETHVDVNDLLSYHQYSASLYAINDVGESDPSNVTITKVTNSIKETIVMVVLLVILLVICVILGTIRLYFKIKKRVLPNVPEPVYYNLSFMTQSQYSHPTEPEVFDELNSLPVDISTESFDGVVAVIPGPAVGVTSEGNGVDLYLYTRFANSNGSLVHNDSRDFTGLQAGGAHDILHNTYTSLPSKSEDLPYTANQTDRGEHTQMQSANELDDYARVWLLSENPEGECASAEQEQGIIEEVLDSGNRSGTGSRQKNHIQRGKIKTQRDHGGNGRDNYDISANNRRPDFGVTINTFNNQCGETDPYVSKYMTAGISENDSAIKHSSPVSSVLPSEHMNGLSMTRDLDQHVIGLNFGVRGHQGAQSIDNDSYLCDQPNVDQSLPANLKARDNTNFSNDLNIVRPNATNSSTSTIPYIPNVLTGNGCSSPLQVEEVGDPYISNQVPFPLGSGNKVSSFGYDPYVSNDPCLPGSKVENVNTKCDPYVCNNTDAARWVHNSQGQSGPYVHDQSYLTGNSDQTMSNDPYIPHKLASGPDITKLKQERAHNFDPYIPHSSLAPNQNILTTFGTSQKVLKSPETGVDQYRESRTTYSSADSNRDQMATDPYVTHECAALVAKSQNLDPLKAVVPLTRETEKINTSAVSMAHPLFQKMDIPVDPYISHADLVNGSCYSNLTDHNKPCHTDSTLNTSVGSTLFHQKSDPYVCHDAISAGLNFGSKPQSDPLICKISDGSNPSNESGQTCDDPYIPHESLTAKTNRKVETMLDNGYVSHDAVNTENNPKG